MPFQEYSLLLVSVSETLNNLILSLFSADGAVTSAGCITAFGGREAAAEAVRRIAAVL